MSSSIQVIQASASGEVFTVASGTGTEAEPEGLGRQLQVLSQRTPDGWVSKDIATPHNALTGHQIGQGEEYRFFSEDLSTAVVQPFGFTPLENCTASGCTSEVFPPATEQTPYLRHNATCTSEPSTCYEPLLTTASGSADVPAGVKFGSTEPESEGRVHFRGATSDGSHVILDSPVQLTTTPSQPPGKEELYEWAASKAPSEQLQMVSVLPNGEAAEGNASFGYNNEASRHAISANGARVFFTTGESANETHHLYMRDVARKETVVLDPNEYRQPYFQAASADGSKVFFIQPPAYGEDELYECDITESAGKLACDLKALAHPAAGEASEVQGGLLGVSEDGSYVYFVDNALLGDAAERGATHGSCEEYGSPVGATCNLYVYHDGKIAFIAQLSAEDGPDWDAGSSGLGGSDLPGMTARVSPNGQWLEFMSQLPLTGYDNRDAASEQPDQEVYLYHANDGKLVCASCDPSGQRPVGFEFHEVTQGKNMPVFTFADWGEKWLAASVPGWTPYSTNQALYQSRYLLDSGTLFFNSYGPLVPGDVNGTGDVYEYVPGGTGGCTTVSTSYAARSSGCVSLISSGNSSQKAAFLDASESGSDVFFISDAKLVPEDRGEALVIYDAHECSAHAPCFPVRAPAPAPCESAGACKAGTATTLLWTPPASTSFSGVGNLGGRQYSAPAASKRRRLLDVALRRCRRLQGRHAKHRRAACERAAKRRYRNGKLTHRARKANLARPGR